VALLLGVLGSQIAGSGYLRKFFFLIVFDSLDSPGIWGKILILMASYRTVPCVSPMRSTSRSPRKKSTAPVTSASLNSVGVTLTHAEVATRDRLAQEQSDFIGRAISRSTVLRALVRLAETKIRPVELWNSIEEERQQGRKWGQDATKPPG